MSGALRFLLLRTARHRAAAQLGRLAQPRYAIAALLGLLYLTSLVARPPRTALAPEGVARIALLAGSIGLAGWTAWMWTLGRPSRLLAFSRAEATFLLAGPVSTARLFAYRFGRGQVAVLANALLWTLLLAWSGGGLAAWRELPAAWLLLTTLQLHHLGATLVRGVPTDEAARRWRVEAAAGGLVVLAVVAAGVQMWPFLRAGWAAGLEQLLPAIEQALQQPVPRRVLAPFRAAAAPITAPSVAAWRSALPTAVLVLVLHAVWIALLSERFRRAATDTPAGTPTRSRAPRWSPPLVRLHHAGRAAAAITWKNMTAVARRRRATLLVAGLGTIVVSAVIAGRTVTPIAAQAVAGTALVWAGALALLGPQWIRNDLRTDLRHLDYVRSWPLAGREIVAAEVLASSIVLTAGQLALLAAATITFLGAPEAVGIEWDAAAVAGVLVILPVVNWLHLIAHNALAVLYPGWVPLGPEPRTGVEGLGQQAIVLMAGLGVLALMLLPGVAAAGAVWSLGDALRVGEGALRVLSTLAGVAAALLSSVWVVRWIGERLAEIEPGDVAS